MKMKSRITGAKGRFEVFLRMADGAEEVVGRFENTIVNSGSDLMAKALAGKLSVNGMYLQFTNAAGPITPASVLTSRKADFYHSLSADEGIVRAATMAEPSFSSSDENTYDNNAAVFVAISGSDVIGAALTDGTSRFFHAGLVCLDEDSYENDILFSAAHFLDGVTIVPVEKIANAQVGVRWTVTFTTP